MKVSVFSFKTFEKKPLEEFAKGQHEFKFISEALSFETISQAEGMDAVSVFVNDDCSAPVLEKLVSMNIRFIVSRCAGTDNIDLKRAKELGIKVANVPHYSPYSIAEHTVALILSLNRKLIEADHRVKSYNFRLEGLVGFDLNGKTVGIIGAGKIGGIFAKIMHGFGCRILAFDTEPDLSLTELYDLKFVELDELCKLSDIISLHVPLNEFTKYLINKDKIALMKKGVMIINTCRGGVINTIDLIEGIKSGKIGAVGMDVYEREKGLFFYDHSQNILQDDIFSRLLSFKNVLITGHQGFLTENALSNIAETSIYNLNCFVNNNVSINEVV